MTAYATKFQGAESVVRYQRKLDNRIDRLRHRIERDFLARYAKGDLFDCTIGVGRFIGALPDVKQYAGLDLSQEFVDYVRQSHQGVRAYVGDLTQTIDEPDDRFDCVICLRSLSAIGSTRAIVREMVRIARPGGLVILDYGRKPSRATLNGREVVIDGEDIDDVLATAGVDVIERFRCDALLTRLKKRNRVFRFFDHGPGSYIPVPVLLAAESLAAGVFWERQIVVARKPSK
jgi:SAM-dependent methyltransferase